MPFTNLNHANLGKKIEDKKEIFAEINDDDNNAIVISDFSDSNINVRLSFELNLTTKKQEENFALHKQFSLTSKNFTLYFIKQLLYKCFPNCNVAERKEIESFLEQLKKQRTIPNIFQYSFTLWPSFIRKQIGKNSHGDLYEILSRYIAKTQPDEWTEDKKVEFLKDTLCNYADGFLHNKPLKDSDIQLLATWVAAYNQDKIFKCLIPKDSSLEGYPYIKDLYDSKNKNIFGRAFKGFIQELTTKVVSPVPTSTVTKSEKRESLATVPQHISDIKLAKQSATTVVSPASCVNLYDLLFDRNLVTTFINALTEGRFSKEKVLELLETTLYKAIVADPILCNELLDTGDSILVLVDKNTKNDPFWGTESYIDDLGNTLPCMNLPGQALTHVRARIRNEMALSSPKVQPQPAASIATTTPVTPSVTSAPTSPAITTPVSTVKPVAVITNAKVSNARTNEKILEEDFGFSKTDIERIKQSYTTNFEQILFLGPKRNDVITKKGKEPQFSMLFKNHLNNAVSFEGRKWKRNEYINLCKVRAVIDAKLNQEDNKTEILDLFEKFSKSKQDEIIEKAIVSWTKLYLEQHPDINEQWEKVQKNKEAVCLDEKGRFDAISTQAFASLTANPAKTSGNAKVTTTAKSSVAPISVPAVDATSSVTNNNNASNVGANEKILEEDFGFSKDKIEEMKEACLRDHKIGLESLFIVGPARKDKPTKVPQFHMLFDPKSSVFKHVTWTREDYINSCKQNELKMRGIKAKNKIDIEKCFPAAFTEERQNEIINKAILDWSEEYLGQNPELGERWIEAQKNKKRIMWINEQGKLDFISPRFVNLPKALERIKKRTSPATINNNNNAKASTSTPVSVTPVVVSASMASTTPAISQPPQPVSVNFAADKGINTTLDEWLAAHSDYRRIEKERSDALHLVWTEESSGKTYARARILISYTPHNQSLSFQYGSLIQDKDAAEAAKKKIADDAEELMSQIETKNLASFEDTMSNAHLNGRTFIGKGQPPTTSPPTTPSSQATSGTSSPTPVTPSHSS